LNSGDIFANLSQEEKDYINSRALKIAAEENNTSGSNPNTEAQGIKRMVNAHDSATRLFTEKGLRYDLTVPLARYVVQHQDELAFPFKRFHIGPVWRADRPQKGRYQEFYQCDADVIGTTSLYNEVELTSIYVEVFSKLKVNATIRINNRKILEALAAYAGCSEQLTPLTIIIDKLDKIGLEGVTNELEKLGLGAEQKEKVISLLQ
jgi:histidyl-tRNA synthetase